MKLLNFPTPSQSPSATKPSGLKEFWNAAAEVENLKDIILHDALRTGTVDPRIYRKYRELVELIRNIKL